MNQASAALTARQACLADLDELAGLFDAYRQFYGRTSDVAAATAFLRERFNHGESVLFIAHAGTQPVGFAQLYPSFSSVSLARTYVLNDLYVDERHRRAGAGHLLLNTAAQFAQALGAIRLTLSTARHNTTAQSVYADAGWQRDEQFLVYHLPLSA